MLKIYLADLVYDTGKTNFVVPLNVAYIAAYVQGRYPGRVDIRIFKYPSVLESALLTSPPDILGVSNYSWNERLAQTFIRIAKHLNPNTLTVMGGPNIRADAPSIEAYLRDNLALDCYILHEGEEPFCNLVDLLLDQGSLCIPPQGCARLVDGNLHYVPVDQRGKSKDFDYPSPYLDGFLDDFIKDPDMIPLFETNRGCPFGCTYCAWGSAALSKVRKRPLSTVYAEMDYVAQKSAGQVDWIFCDANFGILERDVHIAEALRKIMDNNGFPIQVTLWHSKNTSGRNIEIAKTIRDSEGYIAIQSSDQDVLTAAGRGNIHLDDLKKQVEYYKSSGLEVSTDILIGLPNETATSHMGTLTKAFDLGFGKINIYNIRMLPGTQYESVTDRDRYGVLTKFRPIFGSSGVFGGQRVLEVEESVRGTATMSEAELERFKIIHWLIYFCWNLGVFKPILRFGQENGANPGKVLARLRETKQPLLSQLFSQWEKQSLAEWFDTREDFYAFYATHEHFESLSEFRKLNFMWIAEVFQDHNAVNALLYEIISIIKDEAPEKETAIAIMLENFLTVFSDLICTDLLRDEFMSRHTLTGEGAAYLLGNPALAQHPHVEVEIYREHSDVEFCHRYLKAGGRADLSLNNVSRFLESSGSKFLMNRIRLAA